jgi:LPPG:FO 2-phospho-L-lactate transferase
MKVAILTGGVGGAKLVLGLSHIMPHGDITAIVNTGDDFDHLGLRISPDIDTLLYTLSGKANAAQGWGREGESWNFMAALRSLGGADWFQLGDGDLALHLLRTMRLAAGEHLAPIIADFACQWGIRCAVLPMTNQPVATQLDTDAGTLAFQDYFVARRCAPVVQAIRFAGAADSVPAPGVIEAISDPANRAILIAPSNPYLSVDPILAVPGIRTALAAAPAPVIAVSPLIAGAAVKGPTAKLMAELGVAADAASIARHYRGVIDGMLVDERDPPGEIGIVSARADTLMTDLADRMRVAGAALALADTLRR